MKIFIDRFLDLFKRRPNSFFVQVLEFNYFDKSTLDYFRVAAQTLIPTLFQSKIFCVKFPTSQSPETEVNLAIRPRKIISSMLV